jgi:hypothetical protein
MKKGMRVKIVKDQADDLPKSMIGRYGTVEKKVDQLDGITMYRVIVDGWKFPKFLWKDEMLLTRTR